MATSYELVIDGVRHQLTNEHASSSHGRLILVGPDGQALAPAETCCLTIDACEDEAILALDAAGYEYADAR